MRKKYFIQDLYKENSAFSSQRQAEMVASLLDTVSSDIYSESQRFVFELIQNADDAAKDTNNEIHFDFLPNCLIVSHNGKPFDEKDIISLTGAGASTKRADPTKTGYKGIGFKSVFGKSERVTIFSEGYQFRFDKFVHKSKLPWQIIPIWTELSDLSHKIQKCISENTYAVSTIIEIKKPEELLKDLNELLSNGQILLFLRRVSKISVSYNGKTVASIEKKIISQDKAFNEATIYKDGIKISTWITKTFEQISIPPETKEELRQDEKTPEKLKEADYTELSFAAKIEEGKLKSLKSEESLIFTYLPTKVSDFEFPFLINGSFLTNAAREGLHEDRVWNQWLFKLTAEKIIDWLDILARSKFKFQILQLLPSKFGGMHNKLRVSFNQSLEKSVKQKAFIPTRNGKLKKITEIVVDKTGLSELSFIAPETVISFINQKENTSFNTDSFVNPQLQWTDKLRSFGAMFFETENLEDFFLSDIFKNNHQPSENYSLIEYFHNKAAKEESQEWNQKLKSIPFIYAKGKKLKSPQSVCFPSIDFETEFGEGVSVIHSKVYPKIENNSRIKSWLELLGVKEPSDEAYIENEIIGNIENCINKQNYLQVTRYIFNQHKKGLISERHYKQLQDLEILTTKNEFKKAKDCYLSDFYLPALKLQNVIEELPFVSERYTGQGDIESEWKTLFIKIGVQENIQWFVLTIKRNDAINRYNFFTEYFNEYCVLPNTYNRVEWRNIIEYYKFYICSLFEYCGNYDFSKLFWKQNFKTTFLRINDDTASTGWPSDHNLKKNFFEWCVENVPIFPSNQNKCLKANQIFINEKEIKEIAGNYLPVFDYDEVLPKQWKSILPFKKSLELYDYLEILEKIAKQKRKKEEDDTSKITGKKRIGLIYAKLTALLPDISKDEKDEIRNWSKKNKILSQNDNFLNATELFWLKGTTSNFSSDLELAFIPDELKDDENIEELLSLFGVTVISEFKLIKNKTVINDSLQNELFSISPYLSAIVEKKSGEEFESIFKSLKSSIKTLKVVNAASLELAYIYNGQQQVISKPDSYFDESENTLYFTGKWESPTTMYSLVEHIAKALQIEKYQEELRLFLQLNPEDIAEWLQSKFKLDKDAIDENQSVIKLRNEIISSLPRTISEDNGSIISNENPNTKELDQLLKERNLSIENLIQMIRWYDYKEDENYLERYSTSNHRDQKGKNEDNEIARRKVYEKLTKEGFEFKNGIGENSIVNGVYKGNEEYPLVVKSYKNSSYKFNITPSEWLQLSKDNSRLWVYRGNQNLYCITLKELLKENSDFHVHFETAQFGFEGLIIFAQVFRMMKNVRFQLDSPDFSIANSVDKAFSMTNEIKNDLSIDDVKRM